MTTQQPDGKTIHIISFSILGVPGFQTAASEGTSYLKRINSAINDLDRKFKSKVTQLIKNNGGKEPVDSDEFYKLNQGYMLTSAIRTLRAAEEDAELFKADKEPVTILSTEEFFQQADQIYNKNFDLFYSKIPYIDAAVKERIKPVSTVEKYEPDESHIPHLFLCSGAFFGKTDDTPFPIIMSEATMRLHRQTSLCEGARAFCLRTVRATKSYRLTDYLRETKDENKEKIRRTIELLDSYIDAIGDVKIVPLGPLTGIPFSSNNSAKGRIEAIKKANKVLELESEQRLLMYVASMSNLQYLLGDDKLPDAYEVAKLPHDEPNLPVA